MMPNYEIEKELNILKVSMLKLQEKINKIPMPFKFMYKPPGEEEHWNLVTYLDSIDQRLKKLEDDVTKRSESSGNSICR